VQVAGTPVALLTLAIADTTCAAGVVAYGVTALEAACVGLPTICVSPTDGHAVGAVALAEAGCSIHAGRRGVAEREVARILGTLLADAPARAAMSEAGRALIDGRGATRVAREIVCQA
jgi:spore coat polysaccharide biosynthesis predicted glycosyltransferase SpsG